MNPKSQDAIFSFIGMLEYLKLYKKAMFQDVKYKTIVVSQWGNLNYISSDGPEELTIHIEDILDSQWKLLNEEFHEF